MNRFWSKVDAAPSDCCWEWLACKTHGYGRFGYQGKMCQAHRVAYQLAKGIIPEGMVVRHTCDNPACCNPNHLVLGTQQDNINDMDQRERRAKGITHGQSKLTDDQVRQVFLAEGTLPYPEHRFARPGRHAFRAVLRDQLHLRANAGRHPDWQVFSCQWLFGKRKQVRRYPANLPQTSA